MIGSQTVTVRRRAAGEDRYGDSVLTGEAVDTEVHGCLVEPRTSNDLNEPGRQGVIVGLTAYMPSNADVRFDDQVVVDGTVYAVDGEPGVWRNRIGMVRGIEVALTRAGG